MVLIENWNEANLFSVVTRPRTLQYQLSDESPEKQNEQCAKSRAEILELYSSSKWTILFFCSCTSSESRVHFMSSFSEAGGSSEDASSPLCYKGDGYRKPHNANLFSYTYSYSIFPHYCKKFKKFKHFVLKNEFYLTSMNYK